MLALNQSNRAPRLSVSRSMVQRSCAYRPPSPSTLPVAKVGQFCEGLYDKVGVVKPPLTWRVSGSLQPSVRRFDAIGTGIRRPFPLVASGLATKPYGTVEPAHAPRSAQAKSKPVLTACDPVT